MAIKKTILKKKIEGVIYDLYVKTSADLVQYDDATTVATKISGIVDTLDSLTSGDNSVDSKIKAATDALFEKIMGVTDSSSLNEAFDTLKEVSDYLAAHGEVVQGINDAIKAVQDRCTALETDVAALKTTVGDAESGLVKDTAALKVTVGDSTSGLVADVAALQAVGAVKVEASETNGNIKINGAETKVYDDSAIAATKIVEDETHRFTTDTEKAAWNANAEIIVASSVPADLAETDLLFLTVE